MGLRTSALDPLPAYARGGFQAVICNDRLITPSPPFLNDGPSVRFTNDQTSNRGSELSSGSELRKLSDGRFNWDHGHRGAAASGRGGDRRCASEHSFAE